MYYNNVLFHLQANIPIPAHIRTFMKLTLSNKTKHMIISIQYWKLTLPLNSSSIGRLTHLEFTRIVHLGNHLRSFSPPCFQAWHFHWSFFVAKDQDTSMHKEGNNWLGSNTALKKPVVIMHHKLNLSQRNKDNTSQKYLIRLLYVGHPWQSSCSTQRWWNLSWNIVSSFRYHIKK